MGFMEIIEAAQYDDLPPLPVALDRLEVGLEAAWLKLYQASEQLANAFNEVGACLLAIRGDDDTFSPYCQAGFPTWQAYVEGVLEPKMGLSYVRATQIVKAYESGIEVAETLASIERSRVAQLIADKLNASLPKQIPTNEAPLRALAGLEPEEKTAVLGIAEMITDSAAPTFTDVKRAKELYRASQNGVLEVKQGEPLTKETVDNALLYDRIVADARKLPVLLLMRLEQSIADLVIERSHKEENESIQTSGS